MRKKQSVTQRVVVAEEGTSADNTVPADVDSSKDPERSTVEGNKNDHETISKDTDEDMGEIQAPSLRLEAMAAENERAEMLRPEVVDNNLFDEDGNAILPDGTLIIQPTDVDGADRSGAGPPPPPEGASLQFDFKDGNPDPKLKLAANLVNSQSSQSNLSSGAGSISTSEPGVLDVVKCTTCTAKLNPYHKDDLAVHPVLKVITCKRCVRWYNSVEWSKDEDGKDNQCRWCGEGGQLICCDVCHNTFCKTCIKRNLGRTVLQEIEDLPEDALWRCYVCDQAPLLSLQQGCAQVLEKVEAYRLGKLQRKYRLQAGKKQTENKKPGTIGHPVPVGVTPNPAGIRPQMGSRMPSSSSLSSGSLSVPRPTVTTVSMGTQRHQFNRLIPSAQRGGGIPRSVLPTGSGVRFMGSSGGTSRPLSSVISSNPVRYPTPNLTRPNPTIRAVRSTGRAPVTVGAQPRAIRMTQAVTAAASAAGSSAATEEWYEQNCSLREILKEVNSVDPNNIEFGLKTTLKELQTWTRKCNHLENELRFAVNDAQRRTVVHKFKSTFRLNLLLRLGKIYTLMQKESGLQMALAARYSTTSVAQSHPQATISGNQGTAAAKKLIVTSNRSAVPGPASRVAASSSGSGAVIDLTEDGASSSAQSTQPNKLWVSVPNNSSPGLRIANLMNKVHSHPKTVIAKPPIHQRLQTPPQPLSSSAQVSNHVSSSNLVSKSRQRVSSSSHVTLVSSEEEEDEDFDGMVDDRTDKTWTSSVSRLSGTRRKSARLAAKTTPTSATEGSESSQGVEEGEDSRSRSPVARLCPGRRNKTSKSVSSLDLDAVGKIEQDQAEPDDTEAANSTVDLALPGDSKTHDEKIEEPKEEKDGSELPLIEACDNPINDIGNRDELKTPEPLGDLKPDVEDNHENGDSVVPNGINNDNSLNESTDNILPEVNKNQKSCDNLFSTMVEAVPEDVVESNFIDELCESIDNPFHQEEAAVKGAEIPSEVGITSVNPHSQGMEMETSNISAGCADSTMIDDGVTTADNAGSGDDGTSNMRGGKKSITISMWGPAAEGDELLLGTSGPVNIEDSAIGVFTGKRRASELDDNDEKAKRPKLDQ